MALAWGGGWWEVHLAIDVSIAIYLVLLLETKRRREERLRKVRPLATRRPVARREHAARLRASTARR